jgi:hypothetical protein
MPLVCTPGKLAVHERKFRCLAGGSRRKFGPTNFSMAPLGSLLIFVQLTETETEKVVHLKAIDMRYLDPAGGAP